MAEASGVVVQKLSGVSRERVARHLLRLPPEDRRLRFGGQMRDLAIEAYAGRIDFAKDQVFGIVGADLELWGVAHLALDPDEQLAELGLSVDRAARGKGYGYALLQRGLLHATNRGYQALFMHCLAENEVMMRLARKAGLNLVITSGEADGRLALGEPTQAGAIREAMQDQFALVDSMLKHQYSWLALPRTLAVPEKV